VPGERGRPEISRFVQQSRSDPFFHDLPPVWLDEEAESGVVVPRVEVLQAGGVVKPLADEALGLGQGQRLKLGDFLAVGAVGGALSGKPRRISDRPDRAEAVGMEVGRFGRDGAARFGPGDADIGVRSDGLPRSSPISVPGRRAWQRQGGTQPYGALEKDSCYGMLNDKSLNFF